MKLIVICDISFLVVMSFVGLRQYTLFKKRLSIPLSEPEANKYVLHVFTIKTSRPLKYLWLLDHLKLLAIGWSIC